MRKYPFNPELLDALPEELAELFRSLELALLDEICSRLKLKDTLNEVTVQDIKALRSHGIALDDIQKAIKDTADISQTKLNQLMDDVVERNREYYTELIDFAGITRPDVLVDALEIDAIRRQTQSEFTNITRSLGFLVDVGKTKLAPADAYQWALDNALLQIDSGAINYNEAIKNAVRQLSDSGIRVVEYESGHMDHADVAARRAIMTGVSQLCAKYTEQSAEYLETDFFEISAHIGARDVPGPSPWSSHKEWQGKVYSVRSGDKYPNIYSVCGLGYVDGLEGANCRHIRFPFVDGVSERTYTDKALEHIDDGHDCTYEGRHYTAYEATQKQREIERTVRKLKRREISYKAAGLSDEATATGVRRRRLEKKYREFSKAAGLPEQKNRMHVYQNNQNKRSILKSVNNDVNINTGDVALKVDIEIDRFTPCLVDNRTSEIVQTTYTLADKQDLKDLQKSGWLFNWNDDTLSKSDIYKLTIKDDSEIQGLLAIEENKRNLAVHISLAESAPHNKGKSKMYDGVGGHLFAIAAQKSVDAGFGGFLYLEAKNMDLVNHYRDKFGAILIGRPHEYSMIIDEDAAIMLLNEYTL